MGGEGCFAHKGIYSLDFKILIVFALSNLTIANFSRKVLLQISHGKKNKIINFH